MLRFDKKYPKYDGEWAGGSSERSHTLTQSGGLEGWNFLDKDKGLLGGRREGVSDHAGGFKNVN